MTNFWRETSWKHLSWGDMTPTAERLDCAWVFRYQTPSGARQGIVVPDDGSGPFALYGAIGKVFRVLKSRGQDQGPVDISGPKGASSYGTEFKTWRTNRSSEKLPLMGVDAPRSRCFSTCGDSRHGLINRSQGRFASWLRTCVPERTARCSCAHYCRGGVCAKGSLV